MAEQTKFSTIQYNQRFLIIKDSDSKPFVIGEVYLKNYAEFIAELLQKHSTEEAQQSEVK